MATRYGVGLGAVRWGPGEAHALPNLFGVMCDMPRVAGLQLCTAGGGGEGTPTEITPLNIYRQRAGVGGWYEALQG